MRDYLNLFLLLIGMTLWSGCYESTVPLSASAEASIDSTLIGIWEEWPSASDRHPDRFLVLPFNEHEYYVEWTTFEKDSSETARLRVYTTAIEGIWFANAQQIDLDGDRDYMFFRYDIENENQLMLRTIDQNYVEDQGGKHFETSEALRDFFRRHLLNEKLYDEPAILRRVGP